MVLAQKQTHRPMEQNREARNKPMHLWSIIYNKEGKDIPWGKDSLFNKWCWENWTAICKRIKMEYFLIPYTKINSQWIKYLKCKLLEENIDSTRFYILRSIILDLSPQARGKKAKMGSKNLLLSEGNYQQNEKAAY